MAEAILFRTLLIETIIEQRQQLDLSQVPFITPRNCNLILGLFKSDEGILSGEEDTIAPPSEQADVHYSNTPNTTDKLLFEVASGDHSVANTPNGGDGVVGQIALSWLKLQLEEKECYCPLLTNNLLLNPPAASNVLQNFECEALGINPTAQAIGYSPNPTKNTVTFNITEKVLFELFSPLGQSLLKNELTPANNQIDLSAFPTGIYYLRIKNKTMKLIKVD